jgi:hypothetical protein
MDTTYIISAWTDIIQYFFPIFTAPTAKIFLNLTSGWILCTAEHTITGILPFAEPDRQRTHDAYHRFFPDASWAMSELWRFLTILLVRIFYPSGRIHLDLDDTLFHHSGRKVDGAGWWRDAVRSSGKTVVYAWGLNLVVLTLRVNPPWGGRPLGLPVNMRLHRKNGLALLELAEEMLTEVVLWLEQRRFLCHCDGFYASLAGYKIPNMDITSRMRRDATIYDVPTSDGKTRRGRPRKKGKKLLTPQQMAKRIRNFKPVKTSEQGKEKKRLVYARKVIWYRVSQHPVLLVISRDPTGKEKDDFIFTTDLSLDAEQVIGGFSGRWSIEDTIYQEHQTACRWPGASDVEGPRSRACCGDKFLALFGHLALVSSKKNRAEVLHYPAVVPGQDCSELFGCVEFSSRRDLAGKNSNYVREKCRT